MEDKYTPTIHYRYGQLQRENAILRTALDDLIKVGQGLAARLNSAPTLEARIEEWRRLDNALAKAKEGVQS